MTTGQRIKERRKAIGLSAEQIAAELSVSAATIYRYEKGDIEKLPGYILEPLSKILRTTPNYIMGWADDPSPIIEKPAPIAESELDNALIKMLVSLTPSELMQVDAFVQGLIAARKA
jgi:transcriptional regulator with XRE-family HTH domain